MPEVLKSNFKFWALIPNIIHKYKISFSDLYASSVGTSPEIDKVFKDISKRVDREARSLRQLMMLQGALDLVLTTSRASDKPNLTKQEVALREKLKKDKDQNHSIDTDSCLYKSLMQ